MTDAKRIENIIADLPIDVIFTAADLNLPTEWSDNIRVKLNRMAQKGIIVKVSKGRYYKPRQTMFGTLKPNREEIVKDLLEKDGKVIGYITGYSIYNSLGLTTQISNIIEIGTNIRRNNTQRGSYMVKFVPQPNKISKQNIPLLQLLDAIKNIKNIPDSNVNDSVIRFIELIKDIPDSETGTLVKLALAYPPRVKAILGVILEAIGKDASLLKESLNPQTYYNVSISGSTLPNKHNWNII